MVQRFLQLGSPRPLMGAQFNSKRNLKKFPFFEPFRSRSTSKLAKGDQRSKTNVLPKIQFGYKNAEFDVDFEPLKALQKNSREKGCYYKTTEK